MSKTDAYIIRIEKLINGSLRGKAKKELLGEIKKDKELSILYEMMVLLSSASSPEEKSIRLASMNLSKKMYDDFKKNLKSKTKKIGIRLFDSALLPIPEGVRPAAVDTRSLKYLVGERNVELTLYPITVDSVEIIGRVEQVGPAEDVTIQIESGGFKSDSEIDQFNLFRFERVPLTDCRMIILINGKQAGRIELDL